MSKLRYALVSWTKGPDKDALSIVPTTWILDPNPEESSQAYLVECRTANSKKPVNGWPVEHAVVLQLADKESTLRVAEQNLLKEDTPQDGKRLRKPKRFSEESTAGDETNPDVVPRKKTAKSAARRHAEEEILSKHSLFSPGSHTPDEFSSNENDAAATIKDLRNQLKVLQDENSRLRNLLIKEIPGLLADVRKFIPKEPAKDTDMFQSSSEVDTVPLKQEVKLGSEGIAISAHCWETAKSQKTASAMARVLLMGLFDVSILIKSNLTGGINKVDPSAERRQALDVKKLQALLDAVVNHHPGTKISDIRKSINARLCELRHQVKRKKVNDDSEPS